MANERRDEFSGWAGKLDEPGALPGWGLTDKEKAWDRLEARLLHAEDGQGGAIVREGRSRRRIWWLAAACLLPLLGVILYNMKTAVSPAKRESVVSGRTAGTAPDKRPVAEKGAGPETGSGVEKGSAAEVGSAAAKGLVAAKGLAAEKGSAAGKTNGLAVHKPAAHDQEPGLVAASVHKVETPPPANADSNAGSATLLALAVPDRKPDSALPVIARKKLRVISVNEIPDNDIPQSQLAAVQVPAASHFRIGFISRDANRPVNARQRSVGSTFTVHLSSQYP